MDRQFFIAAFFATMSLLVSGQSNFASYKLSLQWPPSVCNVGTLKCQPTILCGFTIQSLSPLLADGSVVRPYDPTTNKCTVNPTDPQRILDPLKPIQDKLKQLWPNLANYGTMNENLWKEEWRAHGMCSDYPTDPYGYFTAALCLAGDYNNPLLGTGIEPREPLYTAKDISEAIKKKLGKYPEIACNKVEVTKTIQLMAIGLCFDRAMPPFVLKDCPKKYSGNCNSDADRVKFPPAPPPN